MNEKPKMHPTTAPALAPINRTMGTDRDPLKLHPLMRAAAAEVIRECEAEALPFQLFEGWRSPERQNNLWEQGRRSNHPGPVLTQAKPWESYHQFGLAGDFVLFFNGQWSWDTVGEHQVYWERLAEIGQLYGLEPLSWEKPHLQVAFLDIAELKAGKYPGGGDASWEQNLQAALTRFPVHTIIS